MSLENTDPTTSTSWKKLQEHYTHSKDLHLKDLFAADAERAKKFSLNWKTFLVDFSKNRITSETMQLLLQLAEEVKLKEAIHRYFGGDPINQTENRAVLHTALRAKESDTVLVNISKSLQIR